MDDETLSGEGLDGASSPEVAFTSRAIPPARPPPPVRARIGRKIALGLGVVLLLVAARYGLTGRMESPEALFNAALSQHHGARSVVAAGRVSTFMNLLGDTDQDEDYYKLSFAQPNWLCIVQGSRKAETRIACDGKEILVAVPAMDLAAKAPAPKTLAELLKVGGMPMSPIPANLPSALMFLTGTLDPATVKGVVRGTNPAHPEQAKLPTVNGTIPVTVTLENGVVTAWVDPRTQTFRRLDIEVGGGQLVAALGLPMAADLQSLKLLKSSRLSVIATFDTVALNGTLDEKVFTVAPPQGIRAQRFNSLSDLTGDGQDTGETGAVAPHRKGSRPDR
ncbi:MAG: hypothetical protein HYU66_17470 [Armatimonadetes bacterium]|nr:hypothetical protein [Armatimonadota bacterium]